jgi:hypothetical protein
MTAIRLAIATSAFHDGKSVGSFKLSGLNDRQMG